MAQEPRESADTVHRVSVPFARGNAVETVISDRMMRGRPPLDCVQSEGDMYGVPAPDNWNDPKSDVVDLRDYCARFLREHPPIVDEDDFPTGEFEGYPVKVK